MPGIHMLARAIHIQPPDTPPMKRLFSAPKPPVRAFGALLPLLLAQGFPAFGADAPPAAGIVLWLKADAGITAAGGRITGWADQGPLGNHAGPLGGLYGPTGEEAPALVPDSVNGRPVVRFDGVDDVLEIPNAPSLQPLEGGWTVLVAARRAGPGQGDFPQIIGSRPWVAGLDKGWAVALSGTGLLTSHFADDASGHDVPAVTSAAALGEAFEIWQVEEDRAGGRTNFFRRADLDRSLATSMPVEVVDQLEPIHLGREMGGANNRRAQIDLAEVLVYNRVLSEAERITATSYLAERYALPFSLNVNPSITLTSPAAGASVAAGQALVLEVAATDGDGSVARVEFFNGTDLLATATQPPYRATVLPLTPGATSISAAAVDNRGARVATAAVAVTVTGSAPAAPVTAGLELWLRADAGVVADEAGLTWQDQSGRGNHAAQLEVEARPELVADAVNGRPAFRFDGQDDYLEIPNNPTLQPGGDSWTVFFTGQRLPGSQGDFPQVIGSRPWVAGLDAGWSVSLSAAGLLSSHLADGATGHDVPQTLSASVLSTDRYQVWQVEENRSAGVVGFFQGGALDRQLTAAMPAGPVEPVDSIYIGREIGGANNRRASMELAEVLVYRGVLAEADRRTVTSYLSGRAGLTAISLQNVAPTVVIASPADGATIEVPATVTLSVMAADADGSVASVQFYRGVTLIGTRPAAPYSLSLDVTSQGGGTFTAVATDNLGTAAASAPVTLTFAGAPAGVAVGKSKLIRQLHYSDTFTIGAGAATPEREAYGAQTYPLPEGVDLVENAHGNAEQFWGAGPFSIATDAANLPTGAAPYPGSSGAGSDTGFTQRGGGGDWSLPYGLSDDFIIQFDYVQQPDRVDVTFGTGAGGIGDPGNISLFFRATGQATFPEVGIYNSGVGEFNTGLTTSIPAAHEWHNYAIRVNLAARTIEVFTGEVSRGVLDLNTLRDGAYAPFLSNAFVGIGGAGNDRQWSDNFQVGLAEPGAPPPPFVLDSIARTANGSSVTLSFASRPNRTYAVDFATSLQATGQPGGWQELTDALPSQGAQTEYVDTQAAALPTAFYRVRDVTP